MNGLDHAAAGGFDPEGHGREDKAGDGRRETGDGRQETGETGNGKANGAGAQEYLAPSEARDLLFKPWRQGLNSRSLASLGMRLSYIPVSRLPSSISCFPLPSSVSRFAL